MVLPRFLSRILLLPLLLALGVFPACAFDSSPITPEQVAAYADQHKDAWLAKIKPGEPRLFYTPEQWASLLDKINSPTGKQADWKKAALEDADAVCASTIPSYHVPTGALFGDQEGWERSFGDGIGSLAIAEKIDPQPRYRQALHDRILAACHFDTWGRQGKKGELANMDLAAGHLARGIAVGYDWNRDLFSDAEKDVIRQTMAQRMHDIMRGLYGAIFWSHWYTQNHNHVVVSGLGLAGLAFLDEIPEAPQWLAAGMLDMQRSVEALAADGSSNEGVPYWGYGRVAMLRFIDGTRNVTGSDSMYEAPSMKNIANFRLGCSTPDLKGILLWADSRGFDGPQEILYRVARQYQDGQAQYLADHLPFLPIGPESAGWSLLADDSSIPPIPPQTLDFVFPDWGVATTRSGWGAGDYLISLKAGLINDHHTQLDEGALTFYLGGDWLLLSSGYGLGAGKPGFYDQGGARFNYFSNATESHATLLINGQNQNMDFKATTPIDHEVATPSSFWCEANLTQAYSGMTSVRRRLLHRRGRYALVLDDIRAADSATIDWLAQVPPRTQFDADSATVNGGMGGLALHLLGEKAPFAVHKPTSATNDVSEKRMMTIASEKQGTDVHFAVVLQPLFLHQDATKWQTTYTYKEGVTHVTISDGKWNDDIQTVPSALPLSFAGFDGDKSAQMTGDVLAVGRESGQTVSILAGNVTSAQTGPVRLQAAKPFDFSLEEDPGHGFVFDLGTAFAGTFTLSAGQVLTREDGTPVALSSGDTTLEKGRYYIAGNAAAITEVQHWSARLPDRPDPRSYPVAEASALSPVAESNQVKWEAEDSPSEQYDYAEVGDEALASGGKALMGFGADSSTDSVAWKVQVPISGLYYLQLRFSSTQSQLGFSLLVDGKLPLVAARDAALTGPAGAPGEKYFVPTSLGWVSHYLADRATGLPLAIPLTAGEHEIRLSDPSQPINLDSLMLVGAQKKVAQP